MKEQIIEIIQEIYAQDPDKPLTGSTKLIGDLGFSSLQMLMLISDLENTFDVILPPAKFTIECTIDDVCHAISEAAS